MIIHWWDSANEGIVGLTDGPWDANEMMDWPTDGYDGCFHEANWSHCRPHKNGPSGHTREEWDELAVEMIARWTAWREHLAILPDTTFTP
ncbi:MAG: hypothetical protein WC655_28330 [Candidatus Hydrogenedentales bacterium]|jgi:hypothetical protein